MVMLPAGTRSVEARGESNYQDAIKRVADRHHDHNATGLTATLIREPTNEYDINAVQIRIDGYAVGYLSREDAIRYQPLLQQLERSGQVAEVTAKLTGGTPHRSSFGVFLELADPDTVAVVLSQEQQTSMIEQQPFTLTSGNRVTVDDSGIQVASPTGEPLATFDFSDLRSATRSPHGVSIAKADGSTFDFLCDATTAEGLATALSGGIQSEASSNRSGGLRGIGSRVQERTQQMADNAQARVDIVRSQQAVAAGIDPNTPVDYDNAQQMQRIQGGLIPGERLYAVYDMKGGGTGFVGITDRRLIIQDEGKIRKKRSLISIPYSRITMLASKDEGGMLRKTSELTVIAGSQEFEMEFRSGDKAERAYTFIIQHLT